MYICGNPKNIRRNSISKMNCKLSIALAFALLFLCGISYAQTTVRLQRKGDKYSGAAVTGGREKVMSHDLTDLLRLDQVVRIDVRPGLTDHLGSNTSRTDEMDSDSERLNFFGEDLREACQGMLGGGIGTLVGVALETHDRGYVDHHRLRGFLKIRQGSLA